MTWSGLHTDGVFCKDMGALRLMGLTGDVSVAFTVYDAAHAVKLDEFGETYSPDTQGCVLIRDLGEVALSYFTEAELPSSPTAAVVGDAFLFIDLLVDTGIEGEDSVLLSQQFYYASVRTDIAAPAKYKRFLSRFTESDVLPCELSTPAFLNMGQKLSVGVAYFDGTAKYCRIPIPVTAPQGGWFAAPMSPVHVLALLGVELLTRFDFADLYFYDVLLEDGGKIVDRIRLHLDHRPVGLTTTLVYYNCFGLPSAITLRGREELECDLGAEFSNVEGFHRKTNTELVTSHCLSTGYINASQRDAVFDLATSNRVYLWDGDTLGDEVTITEIDFSETLPRTAPTNLKITYRVADRKDRKFVRHEVIVNQGVFDDTFDGSFE
ncbi:MAG: hypothetical protein RR206_04840 [Bacteroidaceae bacterium]